MPCHYILLYHYFLRVLGGLRGKLSGHFAMILLDAMPFWIASDCSASASQCLATTASSSLPVFPSSSHPLIPTFSHFQPI